MNMNYVQWFACITGLSGSALLSLNDVIFSKWGFIAYLASNILWMAFGFYKKMYALVVQQVGFMATTIFGIVNWF